MDDSNQGRVIPPHVLAEAVLVGIVLGGILILVWGSISGTDEPSRRADSSSLVGRDEPRAESPDESTVATPSPPADATRMERCVSAHQALQEPLEAAGPAMDQWELHIEAMNQLVVGEITLQQATDFWNRTRVGAQRRVGRFDAAWAALRRHGVDCPSPGLMAPATPALRPCARDVEADLRVLEAARTSIRTWANHVRDMDMLRMGMLSPEDATAMWLSMWQRGVRDLDTYRLTEREAKKTLGCPEAAPSG